MAVEQIISHNKESVIMASKLAANFEYCKKYFNSF
jgi:hypothetical protein